ncbi:MAG: PadR family transcriptional regulator [Gemmatimonadetes bacterium]|nr:PadR family transcriptional regulator [Gemmatimonadota bacterium]
MNRPAPSPESFVPMHPLEFRMLLVLMDGPSHGYRIVKALEAMEGGRVVYPANLYRRIRDLLADGLIEECGAPGGAGEGGRRTYVRVSGLGRRVARAEARRLAELVADARARNLISPA